MHADFRYEMALRRMAELQAEAQSARLASRATHRGAERTSRQRAFMAALVGAARGLRHVEKPDGWVQLRDCPECGPADAR